MKLLKIWRPLRLFFGRWLGFTSLFAISAGCPCCGGVGCPSAGVMGLVFAVGSLLKRPFGWVRRAFRSRFGGLENEDEGAPLESEETTPRSPNHACACATAADG